MKFFYYCFYRISSAYKFWDKTGYYIAGNVITAGCFAGNVLALISLFLSFSERELTKSIILAVLLVSYVLNLFIMSEKKYLQLSEQWKDEKYKKLKGWLIFSYILLSFVLFFVSMYVNYDKAGTLGRITDW